MYFHNIIDQTVQLDVNINLLWYKNLEIAWASVISCSHLSDLTEIVHQQCQAIKCHGQENEG